MNTSPFSFALLLLSIILAACNTYEFKSNSANELLVQTDKVSIYDISSYRYGPYSELIKVAALPDVDIYFSNTPITKCDTEYQNYASILMNGVFLMNIFTSIEKVDNGYNISYLIGEDEPFVIFVPDEGITNDTPPTKAPGWGNRTAACIQDLYGSRGWLSVGYFVLTALIPETAIIVATTCAVANYNAE